MPSPHVLPLLALLLTAQVAPDDFSQCERCATPLDRMCELNKVTCDKACDTGEKTISPTKFSCLQSCSTIMVKCYRKTDATCGYCRRP